MSRLSRAEAAKMTPKEFRDILRRGEWTDIISNYKPWPCEGYAYTNLAIVPKEYAFEFLLLCNRNPRPLPVVDVTEPGDPHPNLMTPEADLRTDLPRYRVFKDGELVDEPTDIMKYWRDDLVCFLIGCSSTFSMALLAANVPYRRYTAHPTKIPLVPSGRFHGHMVVSVRGFYNTHDAVRAVQISSRYLLMHGPPVHIGDPAAIGIKDLCKPDPFYPSRASEPPKPGEIVMCWGCGITPQAVAMESKTPFMITHCPGHMFVTDWLGEEIVSL